MCALYLILYGICYIVSCNRNVAASHKHVWLYTLKVYTKAFKTIMSSQTSILALIVIVC